MWAWLQRGRRQRGEDADERIERADGKKELVTDKQTNNNQQQQTKTEAW